jgi:hypothetical protein
MPTVNNDGTLVGAAIRPINSIMPMATAFAFEINGGHHQVATLADRDNIMESRRQWGMLCTVYNDTPNNATYQLTYGYNNNSTDTMDNTNWVVFSGGTVGAGGSGKWQGPALSVAIDEPGYYLDGDRYLVGLNSGVSLSGSFASLTNSEYTGYLVGGYIAEYKSSISNWVTTLPSDGMTIRVNDQDNSFYRYEGTYSTGQWYKERVNQVRHLSASSVNGVDYTITTGDFFTYSSEAVYLIQFGTSNSGSSATLNINGLGQKDMKKQDASGISDLLVNDLNSSNIYNLVYDGTKFRVNQPAVSGDGSAIKYRIVSDERIAVPAYSEYLLYGDLEVNGILDISSTGKVVIINGALNVNGGTVSNSNRIEFVSIDTAISGSGTTNYVARWTPDGNTLSTGLIQDNGISTAINTAPNSDALLIMQTTSHSYAQYTVLARTSNDNNIGIRNLTFGSTDTNIGIQGIGSGKDNNVNIGINGIGSGINDDAGTAITIGGKFEAYDTNLGNSYAVQLQDGTEGIGKVLTSITADGKANWTDRNLQKIITYPTDFIGTNYAITGADNGYSIIIVNGSAAVSITVPTGLTSKMQVGFIQDGTGDVTFATASTTINNAIGGYKIKGQYDQAYLEQGVNTSTYYLLGNTKI